VYFEVLLVTSAFKGTVTREFFEFFFCFILELIVPLFQIFYDFDFFLEFVELFDDEAFSARYDTQGNQKFC
jgi:hypothetical protein